jgi:hypothetical protein
MAVAQSLYFSIQFEHYNYWTSGLRRVDVKRMPRDNKRTYIFCTRLVLLPTSPGCENLSLHPENTYSVIGLYTNRKYTQN